MRGVHLEGGLSQENMLQVQESVPTLHEFYRIIIETKIIVMETENFSLKKTNITLNNKQVVRKLKGILDRRET